MSISPASLQPLMMIAGLGLICWMLMRGKMRRKRSAELPVVGSLKHNSNATVQFGSFSGRQSLGAPPEVLKWQVELHDLARELKGELDSKLIAVRAMTTAYDRAAGRLSGLIRLAEQVEISPQSPLAEARWLESQGWSHRKIADVLNLSELEIAQLFASGVNQSRSPN